MMDFEAEAQMAVEILREGINSEQRFITSEHDLQAKLESWDLIFAHLERVPESEKHFHTFLGKIVDELLNIRNFLETSEISELNIIKKGRARAAAGKWRAVKSLENQAVELEERELKKIHEMFSELFKLMDKHKLIKALKEDFANPKDIEKYEQTEQYYLSQIYRFSRAYEKILSDLISEQKARLGKK